MSDADVVEQVIPDEMSGQRLDVVLAQLFPDYSRSRLQSWTSEGFVLLDGKPPARRQKVFSGGVITLTIPEQPVVDNCEPQDLPLDIVHEDGAVLVINKPANLVMHPAAGNRDGTVQNALLYHYPELVQVPRAGIVHRLDKDTTGLFVVARTLKAHHSLVEQLQTRQMGREYTAIVQGEMVAGGTVDEPIGRHPRDRKRMAVVDKGKPAITHYRVTARFNGFTHLSVRLESGRTHQIRVHMAHINHPLVGDGVYAGRQRVPAGIDETQRASIRGFQRQALHAQRLQLVHPDTAEERSWTAELPADLTALLDLLADLKPTTKNR